MHELKPADLLSRFLFRRKYINYERNVVNTAVFVEKHPKGFSVFCVTSLSEEQIWRMAHETVALDPDPPLLGRCDLMTKYYEQAELKIVKSEPPPKHYNVHGMPVGSDMEEARKLSLRQMMVLKSRLVLIQNDIRQ